MPITAFKKLAASSNCLRLAQRFAQVSDVQDDHGPLSPILRLACASDSVQTLSNWSASDPTLQPWAILAERLWHAHDLLEQFPTVDDSDVVSELYNGELKTLYLPALAATRTPTEDDTFASWLRRLKLWILIRAVTAAEDGHIFEPSIRQLCREVRIACDDEDSPRLPWLKELAAESNGESQGTFESGLRAAGVRLKNGPVPAEDGLRRLINCFERVLKSEWRPDPLTEQDRAVMPQLAPSPSTPAPEDIADDASDPEHLQDQEGADDNGSDDRDTTNVDSKGTPQEQFASKTRVLLLNQAEGHMLQWDWHPLIRGERFALVDFIERLIDPRQPLKTRLGGALTAVSLLASRSGRGVVGIKTGRTSTDDWKVDLKGSRLHRRPPRRVRRWQVVSIADSPFANRWIRTLSSQWSLKLDDRIAGAIHDAMPSRGSSLAAAWHTVEPQETFEHWLNQQFAATPELERLTSPCLSRVQRLCAFEATTDHVLARLVSSSKETVLPSSASYGSFTGKTIAGAVGPPFARLATWVAADEFDGQNAAGSEMDVDDAQFRSSLAVLAREISKASSRADWVAHHNLLTSYVVICILACTGARPITSPFESFSWFDLDRGLIYIDDKAAAAEGGSRICVLSKAVVELLRNAYLPHLRAFARTIESHFPEFARAIGQNLEGDPSPKVPLFFYAKADPEFDWIEVSELGLAQQCGAAWPLPWNFPRHRLATGLRRLRVDAEIIDALMGHAEAGSETHGANSLRVLQHDLDAARAAIEVMTDRLGISTPAPCPFPHIDKQLLATRPLVTGERQFGSSSRRLRRNAAHQRAENQALVEIEAALHGKPRDSLTPEYWEAIGRTMLLRPDRMPQPLASLRYAVYERYLEQIWINEGVRPALKRRFTPRKPTRPIITELALRADLVRETTISAFEKLVRDLQSRDLRPQLARALAAVDMCLMSRLTDHRLLFAVSQHGNIVPVRYGGRWYVEAFEGPRWIDGKPVRRFEVSGRSIDWLLAGQVEQKSASKALPVPKALLPLISALKLVQCETMRDLLKQLCRVVDQYNLMTASGFEAAVMAGRLQVSALPHRDLVRATENNALAVVNDVTEKSGLDESDFEEDWSGTGDTAAQTAEACKELLTEVGRVLDGKLLRTEKSSEIGRLLKESPFVNGDLPHALARWARDLLTRKPLNGGELLETDTVRRYFNALAPKVSAVGHTVHLIELDGDELTDTYYDLIRVRLRRAKGNAASNTEVPNDDTSEDDATTDPAKEEGDVYAVPRLIEFHEYAQRLFGLEDPDWSLVGDIVARPTGRPGIITKAEYNTLLKRLVGHRTSRSTNQHWLECAWVFMLGFRFGLRAGEAVGLGRNDWLDTGGAIVVLVRPNGTRGLKTDQSKRAVPLMGAFSDLERSVADEMVRRFDERDGEFPNRPLISDLNRARFKYRRMRLCGTLLRLIKQVTLNSLATLHHTRHSFACRVFTLLSGHSFKLGIEGEHSPDDMNSVRRLLLGHGNLDRRALWALARLMGHVSPAMLIIAYAHVQVSLLNGDLSQHANAARRGVIDLDGASRAHEYLAVNDTTQVVSISSQIEPISLRGMVNYLRLRRLGRDADRAGFVAGVDPATVFGLESLLTGAASKLEVLHKGEIPMTSGTALLSKLRPAHFNALLTFSPSTHITDPLAQCSTDEILRTVGRTGMAVLISAEHLLLASSFVTDLSLSKSDVEVLWSKSAAALKTAIYGTALGSIAVADDDRDRRKIQIDTASHRAVNGLTTLSFKERAALRLTGGESRLLSRYAFVIMWCCYCFLRTHPHSPTN